MAEGDERGEDGPRGAAGKVHSADLVIELALGEAERRAHGVAQVDGGGFEEGDGGVGGL